MQALEVRAHGADCNQIEYIFSVSSISEDISKFRTKVKFFIFKFL